MKKFVSLGLLSFIATAVFVSLLAFIVLLLAGSAYLGEKHSEALNEIKRLQTTVKIQDEILETNASRIRFYEMEEEWRRVDAEYEEVSVVLSEHGAGITEQEHDDWLLSLAFKCSNKHGFVPFECRTTQMIARIEELRRCQYYRAGIVEGPPFCPSLSDESDTQAASL